MPPYAWLPEAICPPGEPGLYNDEVLQAAAAKDPVLLLEELSNTALTKALPVLNPVPVVTVPVPTLPALPPGEAVPPPPPVADSETPVPVADDVFPEPPGVPIPIFPPAPPVPTVTVTDPLNPVTYACANPPAPPTPPAPGPLVPPAPPPPAMTEITACVIPVGGVHVPGEEKTTDEKPAYPDEAWNVGKAPAPFDVNT